MFALGLAKHEWIMVNLSSLLGAKKLAPPLGPEDSKSVADALERLVGMDIYPASIAAQSGVVYFLARNEIVRSGIDKYLCLAWKQEQTPQPVADFEGDRRTGQVEDEKLNLLVCPPDHSNALALRKHLAFTAPQMIGVRKAIGFGDRLGLATPGHIRAARNKPIKPVFAQQSIREMTRTQRTPEQVMDDATWGVFQEGYREGWGADADHLKTAEDIDRTVAAGFVMFTIDPSEFVDSGAETDDPNTLSEKLEKLPWDDLETTASDCRKTYLNRKFQVGADLEIVLTEEELLRAAVKYGRAVAHTTVLYRHLMDKVGGDNFELEVSVDETDIPTSPAEHFFVASELKRLGVEWVSLAPRFVGEFQKGVDYIGDLAQFEQSFSQHVQIAQHLGPYKISIHSGSDKFSIYPIAARMAGELVHVKTAGTSYLEALRAIASLDPGLFREILDFAFERYQEDKASYHVSANLAKVPRPDQLADDQLAQVLDLFDGRQLLHVTFGSVLTAKSADGADRFRDRLMLTLRKDEEKHYAVLVQHLGKHVAPFAGL